MRSTTGPCHRRSLLTTEPTSTSGHAFLPSGAQSAGPNRERQRAVNLRDLSLGESLAEKLRARGGLQEIWVRGFPALMCLR